MKLALNILWGLLFFNYSSLGIEQTKGPSFLHEYHFSKTTINYDSKSKSYQYTIHIFIDDFTMALEQDGKYKNLNLGTQSESTKADEAIEKYLRTHVVLMHEHAVPYSYLGKEISEDGLAIYCYLETYDIAPTPKIGLKNSILHELYQDQKNIVDITYDRRRVTNIISQKGKDYHIFEMK